MAEDLNINVNHSYEEKGPSGASYGGGIGPNPQTKAVEGIEKNISKLKPDRLSSTADMVYRMSRIYAPFLRYIPGVGPQLAATFVGLGRGFANVVAEMSKSPGTIIKGMKGVMSGAGMALKGNMEGGLASMSSGFAGIAGSLGAIAGGVTIIIGMLLAIYSLSNVFRSMIGIFFQVITAFLDILLAPLIMLFMPFIKLLMKNLPVIQAVSQFIADVLEYIAPLVEKLLIPIVYLIIGLLIILTAPILFMAGILALIKLGIDLLVRAFKALPFFQHGGIVDSLRPTMAVLHPGEVVINPSVGIPKRAESIVQSLVRTQPTAVVASSSSKNVNVSAVINVNSPVYTDFLIPIRTAKTEIEEVTRRYIQ